MMKGQKSQSPIKKETKNKKIIIEKPKKKNFNLISESKMP